MTDDPTKKADDIFRRFQKRYGKSMAEGIDELMTDPDTHSQLVDLRHEIVRLDGLLKSANCKARFMLAFSVFNLVALGVVVLMWVLS